MKVFTSLAIVTLAEASIGIFVKLTGNAVPIFTLNFYRVFFAALFLAAVVPLVNGTLKYPKNNTRDVLFIGALIAAQISIFNIAMSFAPVANVVIFWSVAPFFVFIFSSIFLNERPKLVHMIIFAIAIIGIVIAEPVSLTGNLLSEQNIGNVLALIDGAIYGAMVTYLRSEGKTETSVDIFWFMVIASVYLSPALLLFGPGNLLAPQSIPTLGVSAPAIVWVLALGVISTGLAFLFISLVLHRINANIYSLVDIIVSPLVAAVLAFLVFAEVPPENMIYGGLILLISGFWLSRTMGTRDKDAATAQRAVPAR